MGVNRKNFSTMDVVIYIIVGVFSIICLYPFLMVISGSFSSQSSILQNGYRLIPEAWTLSSYDALLMNSGKISRAYMVTIFVTVTGTILSLFVNSTMGFALSRKNIRHRKMLNLLVLIPILFTGGMVPWYIVCVVYLDLKDTIQALILPMVANGWYILLMRNFFMSVPDDMYESAHIDGANAYTILFRIYYPLAKPVLATVGLFISLAYWNDWWLGMMLVDKAEIQPLQLLLYSIISNIQFLKTMNNSPEMQAIWSTVPTEGLRMAMVVITIGPMILVYPFLQKYFVKGIMVGAVKG
jgi:putative aldouronate transport system permease protein